MRFTVLLCGLMVACGSDRDGDGFSEDCDDANAAIHPFAAELCDGVDNNCDNQIDEGLDGVWYADADADGFGDIDVPSTGCAQPTATATNATDCDDTSAVTYPGATELCDGVDNDCDAATDNGLVFETWYVDQDGDGYGADDTGFLACAAQGIGYSQIGGDCDDTDPVMNPGEPEECDLKDNDCNGLEDDDTYDGTLYYQNLDGDSVGNSDVTMVSCQPVDGWSTLDGDCDDTDAHVPIWTELYCDDGKDNDCNGLTDADDPECQS